MLTVASLARWRALPFLTLALLACGPASKPAPTTPKVGNTGTQTGSTAPLVATIERTECYGYCPVYKVAVHEDGSVDYEGTRFVKTMGKHVEQIPVEKVTELRDAFEKAGYVQLADAYEKYTVTDMPTVITSYSKDGQTKTVKHYLGDQSAPPELTAIEGQVDSIVGTEQWIGTDEERKQIWLQERSR